ncbi:response regulator transcription factor [Caulobacter sp.]|uniref:response regulator transcription factor n=1 Tax=Caulobacter sp. TaxID=78 RepID=UPI001B287E5A|nr:response regulator transcription factor [Caulobacter sp.]MBO9543484.1 response regulator transcription factor [Caulobacter sp.]
MTCLLFVDDHPLYRTGVQRALGEAMPDLTVVAVTDHDEAVAYLAGHDDVDLCLTDYRLVGPDGVALLKAVGERFPTVARGLLCSDPTPELAQQVKDLGCLACLSKARDMDALVEALGELFNGGAVFDTVADSARELLSPKRRLVLDLAAQGGSNKEIARRLGISERTVKDHWTQIFLRLGVVNRAEAVSRAHQLRII